MWQQVRHAAVNESCFLGARNDLNRKSQNLLAAFQKHIAVFGLTQCLSGDCADLLFFESGQALCKTRQALKAALHGLVRQVALCIKAIAQAHGFFEVIHALDMSVVVLAYLQTKAV